MPIINVGSLTFQAPSQDIIMVQADQDYFQDDEGNVTTDANAAAFLLVRKGQDIPIEMADKYGIGKVAQEVQDEAPVEKAATPSSNKAKTSASNKGVK